MLKLMSDGLGTPRSAAKSLKKQRFEQEQARGHNEQAENHNQQLPQETKGLDREIH